MGNYSFKTTLIKKPLTMVPVSKDQPSKKSDSHFVVDEGLKEFLKSVRELRIKLVKMVMG